MKIRVHVIEDNPDKSAQLRNFVAGCSDDIELSTSASFQSGLKAVRQMSPDILLLDMTLPTFDRLPTQRDGRLRPLGGYDLLHKLKMKDLKPRVIIISQLESFPEGDEEVSLQEIATRCSTEFSEMYCGYVYFSQVDSFWQSQLRQFLKHLIEQRGEND